MGSQASLLLQAACSLPTHLRGLRVSVPGEAAAAAGGAGRHLLPAALPGLALGSSAMATAALAPHQASGQPQQRQRDGALAHAACGWPAAPAAGAQQPLGQAAVAGGHLCAGHAQPAPVPPATRPLLMLQRPQQSQPTGASLASDSLSLSAATGSSYGDGVSSGDSSDHDMSPRAWRAQDLPALAILMPLCSQQQHQQHHQQQPHQHLAKHLCLHVDAAPAARAHASLLLPCDAAALSTWPPHMYAAAIAQQQQQQQQQQPAAWRRII